MASRATARPLRGRHPTDSLSRSFERTSLHNENSDDEMTGTDIISSNSSGLHLNHAEDTQPMDYEGGAKEQPNNGFESYRNGNDIDQEKLESKTAKHKDNSPTSRFDIPAATESIGSMSAVIDTPASISSIPISISSDISNPNPLTSNPWFGMNGLSQKVNYSKSLTSDQKSAERSEHMTYEDKKKRLKKEESDARKADAARAKKEESDAKKAASDARKADAARAKKEESDAKKAASDARKADAARAKATKAAMSSRKKRAVAKRPAVSTNASVDDLDDEDELAKEDEEPQDEDGDESEQQEDDDEDEENEDKDQEVEDKDGTLEDTSATNQKKFNHAPGYNAALSPLISNEEMFKDLGQALIGAGMEEFTKMMAGGALKVGTFCSGTEAPILAMRTLADFFSSKKLAFNFEHVISAEIHPAKSAFIERNFSPSISARDITEILQQSAGNTEDKEEWVFTTAYGRKVKIPGNLDLLIAGFCCDDFSHLNNRRKKLNANGESGDTFFAILEYADKFRPKMIILENVIKTPWLDAHVSKEDKLGPNPVIGLDKHFENLGYVVQYMKLDTKDHYLPQTRQRGYMVCVLNDKPQHTAELKAMAETFPKAVEKLKRAASVPMEALLLDFDSPLLYATGREEGGKRNKRAAVKWDKCKLGHMAYVKKHGLGSLHPVTGWTASGYKVLPDHYKQSTVFTNRTTDCIDIAHLRNISTKGIDDRYLNRFLELSQNVFRYEDSERRGIISCLFPNNSLFLTLRGSRVTGLENLITQGYNPNLVDTMNMDDTLLKDMSGNAMTATVVGTFMFAALIHFKNVFDFTGRPGQIEKAKAQPGGYGNLLETHESHPTLYEPVSVKDITYLAAQTVRLCICEGQTDVTLRQIQVCLVCNATSCIKCGNNPKHRYRALHTERKQPIEFENAIKKGIPFQIDLAAFFKSDGTMILLQDFRRYPPPAEFTLKEWDRLLVKVELALFSKVALRSFRRAHHFQVIFDSPDASLKLEVGREGVSWSLYANVPYEPLASPIGKYLRRFPIARMSPGVNSDDLMVGEWEIWNPEITTLQIKVVSSGPLEKSFENERGIIAAQKTYVYPQISITSRGNYNPEYLDQDILGDYILSSECGQAYNSVHARRESTPKTKRLLLFFNQHVPSGDPENFFFSFTKDVARKRPAEELLVVCNMPSSWRKPTVTAIETSSGGHSVEGVAIESFVGQHSEEVDISLDGHWTSLPAKQLGFTSEQMINYRRQPPNFQHIAIHCGQKRAVFEMAALLPYEPPFVYHQNIWAPINKANGISLWKQYHYLLEKELVLRGHGESDELWTPYEDGVTACSSCAPPVPSMQWTFEKKLDKKLPKQIPVEDPQQAASHERAMKARPSAIDIMYRISDSNQLELNIAINPATLIHRAKGSLLLNDTVNRTGRLVGSRIQTSYRLVTDQGKKAAPSTEKLLLNSTAKVTPCPSLAESPFTGFSLDPIRLFDFQAKALTWMLDQERNPQPFREQAIAEASVKEIGYRLEGKATREVLVAGGILAHDVGFGKTILVLSTIALQLEETEKQFRELPDVEGAIRAQATLILVPNHLVDQWHKEAKRFMGHLSKRILVIKNVAQLRAYKVSDIRDAVMVIAPWGLCSSAAYRDSYAQFSGNVAFADNRSMRAQREWHRQSAASFAANLETLRNNPKHPNFEDVLRGQYEASVYETNKRDEYVPSKHVTGSRYKSAKCKGQSAGEKRKAGGFVPLDVWKSKWDFNSMADDDGIYGLKFPLLEMFHWARVVIDEHTYAKPVNGLLLEFVQCSRIWLLSGTPRLGGFHDVKAMASLFGINLGCDDYTTMNPDALKKHMSEFTASEKFAMYQESSTVAWQQTRMRRAQAFLNQFVREDKPDLSHITIEKQIIGVTQTAAEKALYMELAQHVIANDFCLDAVESTDGQMARQIQEASSEGKDGKHALFLQASFPNIENEVTSGTDSDMVQAIQSTRAVEYLAMEETFRSKLRLAHAMSLRLSQTRENCIQYDDWVTSARDNNYGDSTVTKLIRSELEILLTMDEPCGDDNIVDALRTLAPELNKICEELVVRRRSLRVWRNVGWIQHAEVLTCSKCKCETYASNTTLLAGCGHLACSNCTVADICGAIKDGYECRAGVIFHEQVTCKSLAVGPNSIESTIGSKIDYAVALIKERICLDEKVLVFVQFTKVQKKLEDALKAADIAYANLDVKRTSSNTLKQFQNKAAKIKVQVLIMRTAAETAAGSNLTIAPNVIFFEPLYTRGADARYEYDSAMTQAIGRSRRLGQTKTVRVYELLATNTIEVDYKQHRNDRILLPEPDSYTLKQADRSSPTLHGPLASSFAHLTDFDG